MSAVRVGKDSTRVSTREAFTPRPSLLRARRILVTGNAGAGKTRLSLHLAARTALPRVCLDGVVWKPGWVVTPAAERNEREIAIAAMPYWIVDGVSSVILDAADVIIFLDYPRRLCLWRALRRNVSYLFRSRPDLPENCPEIRIIATLLRVIWTFPGRVRPIILKAGHRPGKRLIRLRSNRELDRLLDTIEAEESHPTPPAVTM